MDHELQVVLHGVLFQSPLLLLVIYSVNFKRSPSLKIGKNRFFFKIQLVALSCIRMLQVNMFSNPHSLH